MADTAILKDEWATTKGRTMGKGYGEDRECPSVLRLPASWLSMVSHWSGKGLLLVWLALSVGIALTVVPMSPVHAEEVTYIVSNAQGTVVAKMDRDGNVTYTAAYRPYGKQVKGVPQPGPGYTGHVNDPATGLVYMQQRYYDPAVGRFLSPDPVAPSPGNIFNFGRYTYANNNPVRFLDPFGRETGIAVHAEWKMAGGYQQTYQAPGDWVGPAIQTGMIMLPVIGPGVAVLGVVADPSAGNVGVAAAAILPVGRVGDGVADVTKAVRAEKSVRRGAKAFSREKQALVDMAKRDKQTGGITKRDMQAYKDLNQELPDPFPKGKVRGGEVHPRRTPNSPIGPGQRPHGHVGPVNHIPIIDW